MSETNEDLENIKSFKIYLEHIVSAIESGRYHQDTIQKLSSLIKNYYHKINEEDDEEDENENNSDIEFIDDESENLEEGSHTSKNETNVDSDSETSDSEDESSVGDYSNIFSSTKKEEKSVVKNQDKYLESFISKMIDNSSLHLYKKNTNYDQKLNIFLENSLNY